VTNRARRLGRSRSHVGAAWECSDDAHSRRPSICPSRFARVCSKVLSIYKIRRRKRLGYLQLSGIHRANSAQRINQAAAIRTTQASFYGRQNAPDPWSTVWGCPEIQVACLESQFPIAGFHIVRMEVPMVAQCGATGFESVTLEQPAFKCLPLLSVSNAGEGRIFAPLVLALCISLARVLGRSSLNRLRRFRLFCSM